MKNLKVVALSVVVVTLGAFAFLMPSNDKTTKESITAQSGTEQQTSDVQADSQIKLTQQGLPVAHGVADENGRQIDAEPQRLRAAPPPPSAPSPDSRYRKTAHHNAHDHGKERNHNSHSTNSPNSPPPPTGANKG